MIGYYFTIDGNPVDKELLKLNQNFYRAILEAEQAIGSKLNQ